MDLYDKLIVTTKFERYADHEGWLCAQYQATIRNPDNNQTHKTKFRVGLRDEIVKDAALPYGLVDLKNARKQVEYLIRSEDVSLLGKPTYKPSKQDVLYCICSDAENTDQPFEDWAADLGYDTDSRKAEAIYNECVKTRHALTKLCGSAEALESLTQRTRDIDKGDDNCRQGDK